MYDILQCLQFACNLTETENSNYYFSMIPLPLLSRVKFPIKPILLLTPLAFPCICTYGDTHTCMYTHMHVYVY